jgi:hypothetical protein
MLSELLRALRPRALSAAQRFADLLARNGRPMCVRGRNAAIRTPVASADQLVEEHFARRSLSDHVNQESMLATIRLLEERPCSILEAGSSAWGTDSSRLFDAYVVRFGGEFLTVDIRIQPLLRLRRDLSPRSQMVCDDSARFLRGWVRQNPARRVDLVYLDSYDLDAAAPTPAAVHGLQELDAIRPALRDGSLLLVDDTPNSVEFFPESQRTEAALFAERTGLIPGKGMLIDLWLGNDSSVTKIHHGYQALYRFDD